MDPGQIVLGILLLARPRMVIALYSKAVITQLLDSYLSYL